MRGLENLPALRMNYAGYIVFEPGGFFDFETGLESVEKTILTFHPDAKKLILRRSRIDRIVDARNQTVYVYGTILTEYVCCSKLIECEHDQILANECKFLIYAQTREINPEVIFATNIERIRTYERLERFDDTPALNMFNASVEIVALFPGLQKKEEINNIEWMQ
jgi:hypothetical protein